jgi:hypothetical protein
VAESPAVVVATSGMRMAACFVNPTRAFMAW